MAAAPRGDRRASGARWTESPARRPRDWGWQPTAGAAVRLFRDFRHGATIRVRDARGPVCRWSGGLTQVVHRFFPAVFHAELNPGISAHTRREPGIGSQPAHYRPKASNNNLKTGSNRLSGPVTGATPRAFQRSLQSLDRLNSFAGNGP